MHDECCVLCIVLQYQVLCTHIGASIYIYIIKKGIPGTVLYLYICMSTY